MSASAVAAPLPWLVVTTVGSREQAQQLARAIVHLRLAACAQIEAIESIYRWRGEVLEDSEFRVLFKTQPARYAQIEAAIRQHHPYELPAIHALATSAADPVYAAWVAESSTGQGDRAPIGDLL
ncbi:MAG: divalent-cation tolerance protein CutA [Proteobacteria bacterium]|nr:divalent-cation tolerance protein CutA [Pseudomonadota bacterium]